MLITLFISTLLSISSYFLNASSQEFFWVPQKMVYAPKANKLYIFGENKFSVVDPETLQILSVNDFSIAPDLNDEFLQLNFFESQKKLIAVHKNDGKIYQLQDSSLVRIDRSEISLGLHAGFTFQHRDTLFRFGGYGFWKASNQLIFYDWNTRGWEVYPTSENDVLPPGQFSVTGVYSEGSLYTFRGTLINDFNPIENKIQDDFWRFDFEYKKWSKVYKASVFEESLAYNRINSLEDLYIQLNSKILKIVPQKSGYEIFTPNPLYFQAINRFDLMCFEKDHAYYITLSTNGFKIEKSPLSFFLNRPIESGTYLRNFKFYFAITAGIFMAVLLGIVLWRKRKQKFTLIYVTAGEVRYKAKRFNIVPQQYNVLFELRNGQGVLASRIKDLVHNPELSNAQNERNKLLMIQNLNQEFKRLIGKAIIFEQKSSLDKRIKLYILDDDIKIVIKKS